MRAHLIDLAARWLPVVALLLPSGASLAQHDTESHSIRLDSATKLEVVNGRMLWTDYRGRRALKLAPREGHERDTDQEIVAVLPDSHFQDGVIELDVAGSRRPGYAGAEDSIGYKGFIGVSFRVRGDSAERFYIRPENGRVSSQLFRNRATQYEADPDFPWQRLRKEAPGRYESYVDLEAGAWTRLRIEVSGTTGRLFVNGAPEPALVVNDLRLGAGSGRIALWARVSSEAYFANLHVTPSSARPVSHVIEPSAARFRKTINARPQVVHYNGRPAIKLVPLSSTRGKDEDMLAILDDERFGDGTVEVSVAGAPRPGMPPDSRGFIGIAFRAGEQGEWSEVMYLRPTNGRAADQLRRNHAVQYVSHREFTWNRLRQESPGVYESNVDLEPGAWTAIRVVVSGTTARLFVNGATQPTLVVNDLKHGASAGRIALWAHVETDAYFGALRVMPER